MGKYLDIAEKVEAPTSPSLLKNTGETGEDLQPTCFNCGAAMTPTTDIYGNPWLECRACAGGDGTDRPNGVVGAGADVIEQIIENGEVVAVLICSKILEAHIWLAFNDDFDPKDGKAVFYAHELKALRAKPPAQLREIHKEKLAFGPGSKVRQ